MVSNKIESKVISQTQQLAVWTLILASFLEGGMVMVVELAGAKIIAPYYGTSLYVWASILGVTVGALAAGYFLGGQLSRRFSFSKVIVALFAGAGILSFLLPFIAQLILDASTGLSLGIAVIIAPLFYLMPPVLCMGAISPILIHTIHQTGIKSGRATGNIFAISTLGGILFTLLASFYLIPYLGITFSTRLAGLVLVGMAILLYFTLGASSPVGKAKSKKQKTTVKAASQRSVPVNFLLGVSFVEGAILMVTELLGAKITAPYYGTSIYVWGSVLAVTLGALALGYYLGGRVSIQQKSEENLFLLLIASGIWVAVAPLIAPKVFLATNALGVQLGALVSVLIYMFPPMVLMAMVSPIITQLIRSKFKAGQAAGTVYAISTIGGIMGTFMAGFLLIPRMGVENLALFAGALLSLGALYYFAIKNRYAFVLAGVFAFLITFFIRPTPKISPDTRVVYQSTGILGEWTVLDFGDFTNPDNDQVERRLLLNGIDQTYTQIGFEPLSIWKYPHKLGAYASMKPSGSKALLLGMGGGSIAFELLAMNFDLDIVELDKRIPEIASRYFNYDPSSSNLVIDDARHFIRKTEEKYDIVIIDLVHGEVQPAHVFSREGFEDLKQVINDDALVIINFQGNIYEPRYNAGPLSIYKTLQAVGFNVAYYSIPNSKTADGEPHLTKDIFFIASLTEQDYPSEMENLRYNAWFPYDDFMYDELIQPAPLDLEGGQILVDDKPILELLNAPNNLQWRKNKMDQHLKRMLSEGIPIY